MQIATLVNIFDQPHLAADTLPDWGVTDVERARQSLLNLMESGLSLDLLTSICKQLAQHLPENLNPDEALAGFCRYVAAVRSPLALAALLERDSSALPALLAIVSLGPRWTQFLVNDPDAFELVRQTEGQPLSREDMVGDITQETLAFADERSQVSALARIKNRHLLRIAYGEVIGHQPEAVVMQQLAWLQDALLEAAFQAARGKDLATRPWPARLKITEPAAVVLALSRQGGLEADYAPPLKLLIAYDFAANDMDALHAVHEHFERSAKLMRKMLLEMGAPQQQVELLPLPNSSQITSVHSAEDVVLGLDDFGRTWHRQALLWARPVAGNLPLGAELLTRLESWLFRRYLSRADEAGIKALKRRILMDATLHQDDWRNPQLARGGLANLESAVEFLQLLVGGDHPSARQRGVLAALRGLHAAGAITPEEHDTLERGFLFLRQLQHRMQVLFDATGELPTDPVAAARLAATLGIDPSPAALAAAIQECLERNWRTLRKLLDTAFPEEMNPPREVDLLLDPHPAEEEMRAALAPFGFARPAAALAQLNELAEEQIPFLSTRRCRYLLSGILPQLLCAIASTPDPDRTLDNLTRVSNSLGGKGVLWALFRSNPPSLQLYVRLCAASPYLSDILTTNPGMIDELIDSLQQDRLPNRHELARILEELSRGAPATAPVEHDFKNAQHLRIGVRDILGKEDIDRTHQALADVAETCLSRVVAAEYQALVDKFGAPTIKAEGRDGQPCPLVIVGLGKLGGREPNYHSNLDLLFLFEAEGITRPARKLLRSEPTTCGHFFTQLAQRVTKRLTMLTPQGRLYGLDSSLRAIVPAGAMALSFKDFAQHFTQPGVPLWQWQVLCQARPIFGNPDACQQVERILRDLFMNRPAQEGQRQELRRNRLELENGAAPGNLKRGRGGTLDVEYLVQMLQIENAAATPAVLLPTATQGGIMALASAGVLPGEMAKTLAESYRVLRRVESGLRLLNTSARHDLPPTGLELQQLALLLGHGNPQRLRTQCLACMATNRAAFDRFFPPDGAEGL